MVLKGRVVIGSMGSKFSGTGIYQFKNPVHAFQFSFVVHLTFIAVQHMRDLPVGESFLLGLKQQFSG